MRCLPVKNLEVMSVIVVASNRLYLNTHDTGQRDCPWRDVVTPEIEDGGKRCNLEWDQECFVDED